MEDLFNPQSEIQEEELTDNVVNIDELDDLPADDAVLPAEESSDNEESVEDTEESSENEIVSEEKEQKPTKNAKKEDKLSPYEQAILAEMERRANEDGDTLVADALKSADKNIHDCFNYVKAQAKKKAVSGCAMIEDSVVYGWAHHYYIEPKSVIDAELNPKPKEKPKTDTKTATTPSPTKSKEKPKTETKPKKKGSYADNPLLKSIMEKNKGKGKSKTITTNANGDRVEEVKGGNGKIYKITEFSLF